VRRRPQEALPANANNQSNQDNSMNIVFVDGCPGGGPCAVCGNERETRIGVCFDCASSGELRAAQRTAAQHLSQAWRNIAKRKFSNARYDLSWAWQRLTGSGDYAPGGYFDREYPGFRR
jgi:hypothetical protein